MKDKANIRTNRHPRDVLTGADLTDKEQKEFDYIDFEGGHDGSFVRYKGVVYDLGEFQQVTDVMRNCHGFAAWDRFQSDSYFSGVLIKYVDDFERVIVGTYFF